MLFSEVIIQHLAIGVDGPNPGDDRLAGLIIERAGDDHDQVNEEADAQEAQLLPPGAQSRSRLFCSMLAEPRDGLESK